MGIGAVELPYSDFLNDPTCVYYLLDSKSAIILVDGDKSLCMLISCFFLERLKVFKVKCGQSCEIQEISFYDLLHDPGCLLRAIRDGKYVRVEDEMSAAPVTDLSYILYC